MKRLLVAMLAVPVLALGLANPAEARDDHRGHRGPDRAHQDRRDDRRPGHVRAPQRHDYRGPDRRDHRRPAPPPRVHYVQARPVPRGHAPGHYKAPPPRWVVGRPYTSYYNGPMYVVHDYYRYDLRRPPAGYRWMRSDHGDMILVAIATGIIADILLHH